MKTAQELTERLDKEAEEVKINPSDLIHIQYKVNGEDREFWVSPYPAKTSKGVITGKSSGEVAYLTEKIGEVNGLEIIPPSVHATVEAAYSKSTKDFRNKVLWSHHIGNGLMIQRTSRGFDVRRVLGARFIDEEINVSEQIVVDDKGKKLFESPLSTKVILQTQYIVGTILQTEVPKPAELDDIFSREKYFDDFKGVIPADSELNPKGRIKWEGTYFDDDGLSFVWSRWFGCIPGKLSVGSTIPQESYSEKQLEEQSCLTHNAIPIFTERNPKK